MIRAPLVYAAGNPAEEVEAHIPVSCTAKGTTDEFQFEIEGENGYKPAKNVLYLKDGETNSFDFLFQVPGTYNYEVFQTKKDNDNILYDGTVYAANVYVTEDEAGILTAETVVYMKGSDNKSSSCNFINKFPKNADEEPETEQDTEKQPETNGKSNGENQSNESTSGGNGANNAGGSGGNGSGSNGSGGGGGTSGADATAKGDLEKSARVGTGDTSHAEFYAGLGLAGMIIALFAIKKKGERRE